MNEDETKPELHEYIFTFGFGQGHDNCFVAIKAIDYGAARGCMVEHFRQRWGFQYNSREEAGVDRFYLSEIDLSGRPILP